MKEYYTSVQKFQSLFNAKKQTNEQVIIINYNYNISVVVDRVEKEM